MGKEVKMKLKQTLVLSFIAIFFFACDSEKKPDENLTPAVNNTTSSTFKLVSMPKFVPDSAYYFIEKQVNFGPRIPNTNAAQQAGDWLIEKMASYADTVYVQSFSVRAWNGDNLTGRNIIASFNPDAERRIMLSAHWDTRPSADMDPDDRNAEMDGANDGASGVGVLIEIGRLLVDQEFNIGIDIAFWDIEDYGASGIPDSYCYGSQHWSANPHLEGYKAEYGILLDMVGAKGAQFRRETHSTEYAYELVNQVWMIAGKLGHSEFTQLGTSTPIVDDHYYINIIAGIPTIDIIDYREYGFAPSWHTTDDNLQGIDKEVLRAAGETVLQVVFQEINEQPVF